MTSTTAPRTSLLSAIRENVSLRNGVRLWLFGMIAVSALAASLSWIVVFTVALLAWLVFIAAVDAAYRARVARIERDLRLRELRLMRDQSLRSNKRLYRAA